MFPIRIFVIVFVCCYVLEYAYATTVYYSPQLGDGRFLKSMQQNAAMRHYEESMREELIESPPPFSAESEEDNGITSYLPSTKQVSETINSYMPDYDSFIEPIVNFFTNMYSYISEMGIFKQN